MLRNADNRAASAGPNDDLTYHDAQMILALLEGWNEGTVSLKHGNLIVEAVVANQIVTKAPAPRHVLVRSPAVGILTVYATQGRPLSKGDIIGVIDAPGRSTSIVSSSDGILVGPIAPNGSFVEYDQQIAALEPTTRE